jgi:uncharacterized radical SAM superfamily protein
MVHKQEYSYFSLKSNPAAFKHNIVDSLYISQFLEQNKIKNIETLIKTNPDLSNQLIKQILSTNFGNQFNTFIPGKGFSSISVTGSQCDLECEHCNLKYLTIMKDGSDENKLRRELDSLIEQNAQGCLVSGGCTSDGKVPFLKFKDILKEYRHKSNLIFNFHVGLLSEEEIKQLAEINPHVVSFDITMDDEIIKNIYHMKNRSSQDYKDTFENLRKYNINIIPHITVGLNFGLINKEIDTLQYLSKFDLDLIVFIILIPPEKKQNFKLPAIQEIQRVFMTARLYFPTTELSLGCMRPRGKSNQNIEETAIKAGINRIVIPSNQSMELLKSNNSKIKTFDACCAIPLNVYKLPQIPKSL